MPSTTDCHPKTGDLGGGYGSNVHDARQPVAIEIGVPERAVHAQGKSGNTQSHCRGGFPQLGGWHPDQPSRARALV